jgi:hypothetical protein
MKVRTKSLDMEVTSHIASRHGNGVTIKGEIRVVHQELRHRDTDSNSDRPTCLVGPKHLDVGTILAQHTQTDDLHVKQA